MIEEKTDHDLLVTLAETVKQQHIQIMTRIDSVKTEVKTIKDEDLKEIKNGTQTRIAESERRIVELERLRDQVNPIKVVDMVYAHEKWINEFRISWRAILLTVGTASSIVTFILAFLLNILKLLGGK